MRNQGINRTIVVLIVAVLAFGGSALGLKVLRGKGPAAPYPAGFRERPAAASSRIVSLAPSITETLFALGLGERVVAVTRYCQFPAEARRKVRIGGFYDANTEAILALAPDLVVLLPEQEKVRQFLAQAGIGVLTVNNKTVSDCFATIAAIGERCGVEGRAKALAAELARGMERIRQGAGGGPRPRVLVSIGGNMGRGPAAKICMAGPGTFYGELVELAGGDNAYQGKLAFPEISREGLLELNPGVIIDIAVYTDYRILEAPAREAMLRGWQEAAAGTEAARRGRIHIFEKDYMVIPGPRFVQALQDVATALRTGAERTPP